MDSLQPGRANELKGGICGDICRLCFSLGCRVWLLDFSFQLGFVISLLRTGNPNNVVLKRFAIPSLSMSQPTIRKPVTLLLRSVLISWHGGLFLWWWSPVKASALLSGGRGLALYEVCAASDLSFNLFWCLAAPLQLCFMEIRDP